MKNKNIVFVMLSLFVAFVCFDTVLAGGLNVILQNQNPDPVTPGNFVYLNVKVSNLEVQDNSENLFIKFNENKNFKLANGESNTKNLGSLDGDIIVKFKLLVDEKTPTGLNSVKFDIVGGGNELTYEVDVLVQDVTPQIHIESIDVSEVKPGGNGVLKLRLENTNNINLQDVKVNLNLEAVEDKVISLNGGTNEMILKNMVSESKKYFTFDISINPEASSKPYLLPIDISYTDSLGNSYSSTIFTTVKVYSKPYLSIELDSQDVYSVGKGKISLATFNPGSSKVKGVHMKILEDDSYEVIKGSSQYVGDLNPDDFQTLLADVFLKNNSKVNLKVQVKYFDSYDNENVEVIEIPLKIYDEEELVQYGFSNGSSFGVVGFLIWFVIGGFIGFFIGKRKYNKK
jgi:hypothetical protein